MKIENVRNSNVDSLPNSPEVIPSFDDKGPDLIDLFPKLDNSFADDADVPSTGILPDESCSATNTLSRSAEKFISFSAHLSHPFQMRLEFGSGPLNLEFDSRSPNVEDLGISSVSEMTGDPGLSESECDTSGDEAHEHAKLKLALPIHPSSSLSQFTLDEQVSSWKIQ
jgi:hypothetical protein